MPKMKIILENVPQDLVERLQNDQGLKELGTKIIVKRKRMSKKKKIASAKG